MVLYADGGGKVIAAGKPIRGIAPVSAFMLKVMSDILNKENAVRFCAFNGSPSCLINEDGALATAVQCAVQDGKIIAIYGVRNPDKLQVFVR